MLIISSKNFLKNLEKYEDCQKSKLPPSRKIQKKINSVCTRTCGGSESSSNTVLRVVQAN